MTRLLCIDPGTRKMGMAEFKVNHKARTAKLTRYFVVLVPKSSGAWRDRIDLMANEAMSFCNTHKPHIVLIEEPQLFLGSAKGRAASNSGAVLKLVAMVYCMVGALKALITDKVITVPVRSWKGNVPKSITQKRVAKYWGCKSGDDNITDAVGIGDWYIRKHLGYSSWYYTDSLE